MKEIFLILFGMIEFIFRIVLVVLLLGLPLFIVDDMLNPILWRKL